MQDGNIAWALFLPQENNAPCSRNCTALVWKSQSVCGGYNQAGRSCQTSLVTYKVTAYTADRLKCRCSSTGWRCVSFCFVRCMAENCLEFNYQMHCLLDAFFQTETDMNAQTYGYMNLIELWYVMLSARAGHLEFVVLRLRSKDTFRPKRP